MARVNRDDPLDRERYENQLDRLRGIQDGHCAICGNDRDRLVIDHDHHTGLVRGLLCLGCNHLEGRRTTPLIAAYRADPPAQRLGIFEHYRGLHSPDWGNCRLPCPCGIPAGKHFRSQLAATNEDCACWDAEAAARADREMAEIFANLYG